MNQDTNSSTTASASHKAVRADQAATDLLIAEEIATLAPGDCWLSTNPVTDKTDTAALRFADEAALFLARSVRKMASAS